MDGIKEDKELTHHQLPSSLSSRWVRTNWLFPTNPWDYLIGHLVSMELSQMCGSYWLPGNVCSIKFDLVGTENGGVLRRLAIWPSSSCLREILNHQFLMCKSQWLSQTVNQLYSFLFLSALLILWYLTCLWSSIVYNSTHRHKGINHVIIFVRL